MNEPTITDYQVVNVNDMLKKNGNKLADRVNEEIANGWVPLGGPMVVFPAFFQAMVKYSKD